MKKRVIAGIITFVMVMGMVGCGSSQKQEQEPKPQEATTQVVEETENTVPEDWYKEILADEKTQKEYPYYKLLDINIDGIDELFLSTTNKSFIGAEDKACLMCDYNGEIKTLQEIGGQGGEYWVFGQSDATLSHYSRLSGESHIVIYKLENGELNQISTADYYAAHHYPEEDTDAAKYMIDGKDVSEEEYEGCYEQYGNEAGAITFEKYGETTGADDNHAGLSQSEYDALMKQIADKEITKQYADLLPDEAFAAAKIFGIDEDDQSKAYARLYTAEFVALKDKAYEMSGSAGEVIISFDKSSGEPKLVKVEWSADGEDHEAWMEENFPGDYKKALDVYDSIRENANGDLFDEVSKKAEEALGVTVEKENLLEIDTDAGTYKIIKTIETGEPGEDYKFETETVEEGKIGE
jgi:hypothetical protein